MFSSTSETNPLSQQDALRNAEEAGAMLKLSVSPTHNTKAGSHGQKTRQNNMQAIITKFLPPTNARGSRYKATCERGSLTVSADDALSAEENHRAACDALCEQFDREDEIKYRSKLNADGFAKYAWSRPKVSGQIPSGEYVFCFIPERFFARKDAVKP